MLSNETSILIIYTGGTIGMINDPETGSLAPFDFEHLMERVPELKRFGFHLSSLTFDHVIDSSNINAETWIKLASIINDNYDLYDGFVVLHGTDTMAYSASALSFLIENLEKPIVFTGSQLPIGTIRTDGKENFISAVEIAAAQKNGQPLVPEVSVFFENKLYRGNRTVKNNADYFDAFRSYNYPELAKAGIHITYNYAAIRYPVKKTELKVYNTLDTNVAVLKIFPGIKPEILKSYLNINGLKAIVIETFGSGNAPSELWFIEIIEQLIAAGIILLNISQCSSGSVDMGVYETGVRLKEAGVISGHDMTTEAALTKLMFLLGQDLSLEEVKENLSKSLRGEISI